MAWTARKYFDTEKGAAYDLAAPIFAENKATAESFDRFFSSPGSGRFYLWEVESEGGGAGNPTLPPDPAPVPVAAEYWPKETSAPWIPAPAENPSTVYGTLTAPPERVRTLQAPEPNPPTVQGTVTGVLSGVLVGSPKADPIPIIAPPETPKWIGSPNPPQGTRLIEYPPIGSSPTPPDSYRPIESFPIPPRTVYAAPTPPDVGLTPRELFPRSGPILFSTPIGQDGHVGMTPVPATVEGDPMVRQMEDLTRQLVANPTRPDPVPVDLDNGGGPPPPAPVDPVATNGWSRETWQKYFEEIDTIRRAAETIPTATAAPSLPTTSMPTRRYASLQSEEPTVPETTTPTDTNAILKQALDTVGVLASVFNPQASTAPSPTAAPAPPVKASPWYESVPNWAWLAAAAAVGFLILRKK